MELFVVYWVDVDDDCPKKSEIRIIGVFDNSYDAERLKSDYDHKGYSEDDRCYYTSIAALNLNKIPPDVQSFMNSFCDFVIYSK